MGKRRGWGEHSIYQRKDGRWVAQIELGFVDGKRKRKYLTAHKRADVNKRLQEYLASEAHRVALNGDAAAVGSPTQTVSQLGTAWLRSRKFSVKYSTIEREESILRCHIYPSIGDVVVSDVVEEQISDILERLGARLAPRTVVHVLVVTRALFNYGLRRGAVDANPTALIKRPRVAAQKPTFLEIDEVQRYIAAANGRKYEAALLLALGTGMRLGEVLGLRWSDVDLESNTLFVTGSLTKAEGGGYIVSSTKTHRSTRPLRMPEGVADALRRRRSAQSRDRLAAGQMWTDMDLVFSNELGAPLSKTNFTRAHHYPVVRDAGIRRITFHGLRHAFASIAVDADVHPRVLQEMMGHSTVVTTMNIYSHVLSSANRRASDAISAAMGL